MKYPNFNEEKMFWKKGYKFVVGLDEAGRGPLAGPVVAGAIVSLNPKSQNLSIGVQDSKKLTPKKREEVSITSSLFLLTPTPLQNLLDKN